MIRRTLEPPIRAALASAAFIVALAVAVPSATAAEATTAIGTLTLNYDDAEWSIEGETIRCIADVCLGAVVDVAISDRLGFCTRDAGYAGAALAFPTADRHAVNAHTVNGLSLVFGRSRISEDPEGWAVYACVTRDDIRYEFTSRIDQTPPRFQDGAIFELLHGLVPPPPVVTELRLGAFVIDIPSDRWRIRAGEDGVPTLECLPPYCEGPAPVFLSAMAVDPDDPDPCGESPFNAGAQSTTTLIAPEEGPPFTVTTLYSMCRAQSPPVMEACAVNEGRRYFLGTGVLAGCNFGPAVAPDLFADLVRALRLAE